MTLEEALTRLEALGSEKMRAQNVKRGAGDLPQFCVRLGDFRAVVMVARSDLVRPMVLWATGIVDARLLAILLLTPKRLTREQVYAMVRDAGFVQVLDWLD